jgi:CubicO group peptidase (beta-lactamase class C family)
MTNQSLSDIPFEIDAVPGFKNAVAAFKANFLESDELGAQFCLMQHGEVLLDLKGGWADRKRTKPVSADTLFSVYSSGKAMAALVIAWLAEEDRLGYNQVVSTLWPEFSQAGKGNLTIAEVMSHQSGLSGITDSSFDRTDWLDWDKTVSVLAAQNPIFPPRSQSGYCPVSYGFLAGEIARLADKNLRTLGGILRGELAEPCSADVWIGLPESEHSRCAEMVKPKALPDLGEINEAKKAAFLKPWSSPGGINLKAWREAELAGSNCHASAKGLATLMQIIADGGCRDMAILSEDTLADFRKPRINGMDQVLPFDISFSAGIMGNLPNKFYGPNAQTLGHSGWGGSCLFADPETGLHGAYVMNRQQNTLLGDIRPRRIIDAVYDNLSA